MSDQKLIWVLKMEPYDWSPRKINGSAGLRGMGMNDLRELLHRSNLSTTGTLTYVKQCNNKVVTFLDAG